MMVRQPSIINCITGFVMVFIGAGMLYVFSTQYKETELSNAKTITKTEQVGTQKPTNSSIGRSTNSGTLENKIKFEKEMGLLPAVQLMDYHSVPIEFRDRYTGDYGDLSYQVLSFQTPNGLVSLATKSPVVFVRGALHDVKYKKFAEKPVKSSDFLQSVLQVEDQETVFDYNFDSSIDGVIEEINVVKK